jgi:hypothetical protein
MIARLYLAGAVVATLTMGLHARLLQSQVVRGTVRERVSGTALPGILVTLESADSTSRSAARSVLTTVQGRYAVSAAGAGHYRLTAKRIGVHKWVGDMFELAAGQTRVLDIEVAPVTHALPEVAVSANALCATKRDQAQRVASLWDEAFTALRATEITQRDSLFRARIVRYIRTLEPRTLKVLNESRRQISGRFDKPWISLSADSLSRVGYWSGWGGDSIWYAIPDADVFASSAFVRDHCFTAVNGGGDHRGLTGLALEPVDGHEPPDIHGTIWLDARTFELRQVEFQYTRLPRSTDLARIRGEIHFANLPNGTWIVRRWFTRVPQARAVPLGGSPYQLPDTLRLRGVAFLVEDGGDVTAQDLSLFETPASLTGMVRDSAGKPLAGARVFLTGTKFETTSGEDGRYEFDTLPPGLYTASAAHPGYEPFGVALGSEEVTLEASRRKTVDFRAPRTNALLRAICGGRVPERGRATLFVTLVDTATSAPLAHVPLRVAWVEYGKPVHGVRPALNGSTSGTSSSEGKIAFCGLPAGATLDLTIPIDDTHAIRLRSLGGAKVLQPNEVRAWVLRIRKPW